MSIELGVPPTIVGNDPAITQVLDYTRTELLRLVQVLNTGQTELSLVVLHVPPERPRDGQIVYADGTNWDPGGGEGFYGRESGVWVKL